MKRQQTSASRRDMLRQSLAWGSGLAVASVLPGLPAQAEKPAADKQAEPRTIDVVAQRFKFTPSEIHIKKGERVVLAIKSLDFVHGMNIPDFNMRADLLPGKITRIELQPPRSGTFDFLCDNFCGDGHETMHGRFIVSD
ncbi:MAG: cupredoxin domain-containing protein [Aquabacterium sp.]